MIPNVPELSELSHDVICGLVGVDSLDGDVVLDTVTSPRNSALNTTRATGRRHGVDVDTASRDVKLARQVSRDNGTT